MNTHNKISKLCGGLFSKYGPKIFYELDDCYCYKLSAVVFKERWLDYGFNDRLCMAFDAVVKKCDYRYYDEQVPTENSYRVVTGRVGIEKMIDMNERFQAVHNYRILFEQAGYHFVPTEVDRFKNDGVIFSVFVEGHESDTRKIVEFSYEPTSYVETRDKPRDEFCCVVS
jgi:hypothetical protein